MSGGSFEYLCWKEPSELLERMDLVERMADKLSKLGYADDAASETTNLLLTLRAFDIRVRAHIKRLGNVWHGMEWWSDYDISEDTFKKDLEKYREELK